MTSIIKKKYFRLMLIRKSANISEDEFAVQIKGLVETKFNKNQMSQKYSKKVIKKIQRITGDDVHALEYGRDYKLFIPEIIELYQTILYEFDEESRQEIRSRWIKEQETDIEKYQGY